MPGAEPVERHHMKYKEVKKTLDVLFDLMEEHALHKADPKGEIDFTIKYNTDLKRSLEKFMKEQLETLTSRAKYLKRKKI